MSGIDWTAARHLAAGLAPGLRWRLLAQALAAFETGAIKGDAKRHKKPEED